MVQFLILDKNELKVSQKDYLEVARYLGYSKASLINDEYVNVVDLQTRKLIEESCALLFNLISPQAVYDNFDLIKSDLPEGHVCFADVDFVSYDLSRNLKGCSEVFIFAATIGPLVDSFIRKNQIVDAPKAAVLQAAGAMFIEKFVDLLNEKIKADCAVANKKCKPRFSPGYGDVSLNLQKDFFRLLPCTKIGLSLMDTLIMSPEKSVTAFIGVYE